MVTSVIPKEFTTEESPVSVKPFNRGIVKSPCPPQADAIVKST